MSLACSEHSHLLKVPQAAQRGAGVAAAALDRRRRRASKDRTLDAGLAAELAALATAHTADESAARAPLSALGE